jgi:hypothetical protein
VYIDPLNSQDYALTQVTLTIFGLFNCIQSDAWEITHFRVNLQDVEVTEQIIDVFTIPLSNTNPNPARSLLRLCQLRRLPSSPFSRIHKRLAKLPIRRCKHSSSRSRPKLYLPRQHRFNFYLRERFSNLIKKTKIFSLRNELVDSSRRHQSHNALADSRRYHFSIRSNHNFNYFHDSSLSRYKTLYAYCRSV